MIASHYAEPLERRIRSRNGAAGSAVGRSRALIRELAAGEPFAMLDDSLGWAWGYAGR